jgi:uncharacterized protein YndB with AHSA1/START domain
MATVAPVRRAVAVAAGPERAFEVFTDQIGRWWPLATHSVFGERASVAFEDGRLVERFGDQVSEWGEVLEWDPPRLLRLTWRPGNPAEEATEVTVRFHPDGDGTRVELEHVGWERHARPQQAAEDYSQGWPIVLGAFADGVAAG